MRPNMAQELEGKVAVVTGAASGIGLGVARRFAADGHRVALLDRSGDAAEEGTGAGDRDLLPDDGANRTVIAVAPAGSTGEAGAMVIEKSDAPLVTVAELIASGKVAEALR